MAGAPVAPSGQQPGQQPLPAGLSTDPLALFGDAPAPAVPAGWVLVPVEPTADMRNAFHDVTDNDTLRHGNAGAHWRAMLAAAPDAQKGEP